MSHNFPAMSIKKSSDVKIKSFLLHHEWTGFTNSFLFAFVVHSVRIFLEQQKIPIHSLFRINCQISDSRYRTVHKHLVLWLEHEPPKAPGKLLSVAVITARIRSRTRPSRAHSQLLCRRQTVLPSQFVYFLFELDSSYEVLCNLYFILNVFIIHPHMTIGTHWYLSLPTKSGATCAFPLRT